MVAERTGVFTAVFIGVEASEYVWNKDSRDAHMRAQAHLVLPRQESKQDLTQFLAYEPPSKKNLQ